VQTAAKYRAELEAGYIVAFERSLKAPADEEAFWDKRLKEYEDEKERAEQGFATEEQLQAAWCTARLRGLIPPPSPGAAGTLPGEAPGSPTAGEAAEG
jgi:hypothetical protein